MTAAGPGRGHHVTGRERPDLLAGLTGGKVRVYEPTQPRPSGFAWPQRDDETEVVPVRARKKPKRRIAGDLSTVLGATGGRPSKPKPKPEPERGPSPLRLDLPMDDLAREYRDGMSAAALADKYGASSRTVRDRLREHGVTLRPQGGRVVVPSDDLAGIRSQALELREHLDLYDDALITARARFRDVDTAWRRLLRAIEEAAR